MLKLFLAAIIVSVGLRATAADPFTDAVDAYDAGRFDAAIEVFRALAETGHTGAETMLGVMYFNGQGVERDTGFAAIWCYKASRKGNPNAQLAFGSLHIHGVGVRQDLAKAYKWLSLAGERAEGRVAEEAGRLRSEVGGLLSADERAGVEREVREWRPAIKMDP